MPSTHLAQSRELDFSKYGAPFFAKLPNDERNEAISRHEKIGNKIFIYVILVICLAFVSKIIYFQINNGVVTFSDLIPNPATIGKSS